MSYLVCIGYLPKTNDEIAFRTDRYDITSQGFLECDVQGIHYIIREWLYVREEK